MDIALIPPVPDYLTDEGRHEDLGIVEVEEIPGQFEDQHCNNIAEEVTPGPSSNKRQKLLCTAAKWKIDLQYI